MRIRLRLLLVTLLLLWCMALPASAKSDDRVSIRIRPGVTVEIALTYYENPQQVSDSDETILAIPGLAHTANVFENLADYIFASPELGSKVKEIIALDYPGHGKSELPNGLSFSELTLTDYATIVDGVLAEIEDDDRELSTIIAHSMGALVVSLAQNRSIDQGSSLRRKYGIEDAILLAPSIPGELPWALADSGTFAQLAARFITQTPELGSHISIPAPEWRGLFFANRAGELVAGTPSPEEAIARGYNAPEALQASLQLGGVNTPRLRVREGIFARAKGTHLTLVSFGEDRFHVFPDEHSVMYDYLTSSQNRDGFFTLTDATTVHDAFINDPRVLEGVLESAIAQ